MRFVIETEVVGKEYVRKDAVKVTIYYKEYPKFFRPGHMIEVYFPDENDEEVIQKNLNVYSINTENHTLDIVFKIEDRPTRLISKVAIGDSLIVFGPVGRGVFEFDEERHKRVVIVGGGTGILALHSLAEQISGKAEMTVYMGFKSNQDVMLVDDFAKIANTVVVTTEDNPIPTEKNVIGLKGKVCEIVRAQYEANNPNIIYMSGSVRMITHLRKYIYHKKSACQVSFQDVLRFCQGDNNGFVLKQTREFEDVYPTVGEDGPVFSLHGLQYHQRQKGMNTWDGE